MSSLCQGDDAQLVEILRAEIARMEEDEEPILGQDTTSSTSSTSSEWSWEDASIPQKTIPMRATTLKLAPRLLHAFDIKDLRSDATKRALPTPLVHPRVTKLKGTAPTTSGKRKAKANLEKDDNKRQRTYNFHEAMAQVHPPLLSQIPPPVDPNNPSAVASFVPPLLPLWAPHPFEPKLAPVKYLACVPIPHIPEYHFISSLAPHPADDELIPSVETDEVEATEEIQTTGEDASDDFSEFINWNWDEALSSPSLDPDNSQEQSTITPRIIPLPPQNTVPGFEKDLLPSPEPVSPQSDNLDHPNIEALFTTNLNDFIIPINNDTVVDDRLFVRAPTPRMDDTWTYNPADGAILPPGTVLPHPNTVPFYHYDVAMQDAARQFHFDYPDFPINHGLQVPYNNVALNNINTSQFNDVPPQDFIYGGMAELHEQGVGGRVAHYDPLLEQPVYPTSVPAPATTYSYDTFNTVDSFNNVSSFNTVDSFDPIDRVDPFDHIGNVQSYFDEIDVGEDFNQDVRGRPDQTHTPLTAEELAWKKIMPDVCGAANEHHGLVQLQNRYYGKINELCVGEKQARDRSRGRYVEYSAGGANDMFQLLDTRSPVAGSNGGEVEGIIVRRVSDLGIRREGSWDEERQEFRVRQEAGEHWKTVDEWREVLRSGGIGLDEKVRKDLGIDKLAAGELCEAEITELLADRIGNFGNVPDQEMNGVFGVGEFRDIGQYAVDAPNTTGHTSIDFSTTAGDTEEDDDDDDDDGISYTGLLSGYLEMEFD